MITLSLIASLSASVLLIIMALFVLIKGWRSQVNRYYFFYNMWAFGILFSMFLTYLNYDAGNLVIFNRVTQASTVLCFASFFLMSFVFPRSDRDFPLYRSLLFLTPAFIIAFIAVYTDYTITSAYFVGDELVRDFRTFYTVYAIVAFSYLIAGALHFVIKYMRTKVAIHRLQMRYLFVGASIALILASVSSILLPRLFDYTFLYVIGPAAASFIVTFFLFYSVISYNLMDITTAVHKTVMYSVISMLILLPVYGIIKAKSLDIQYFKILSFEVLAVLIVVIFVLFSVTVQPAVDSLFKRRQYAFENVVDRFILEMQELKDVDEILDRIIELLISSLGLKGSAFYLFDDEERHYSILKKNGHVFESSPDFIERRHPLVRLLLRRYGLITLDHLYVDESLPDEIKRDLPVFFTENSIRIAIPVYHERRLLGILFLSEKETGAGFTPSEISKLEYFQQRSSVFISAAVAYKQAAKEQLVSRTVELSSNILSASIPVSVPSLEKIKFGAFMVPKYDKGADYFDFLIREKEGVGVISADVSGLGINSSFYNVLLRSGFRASADDCIYPEVVMQNINRLLYSYTRGAGELVTAFYFYMDFNSNRLFYTNAGYPGMELFRIEKNNFDTLDTEGIPIGYAEKPDFGTGRTNLVKGDIGLLYSKSLLNSKNSEGETLSLPELRGVITENRTRAAGDIAALIGRQYENFMGITVPESDIVVIVFKV